MRDGKSGSVNTRSSTLPTRGNGFQTGLTGHRPGIGRSKSYRGGYKTQKKTLRSARTAWTSIPFRATLRRRVLPVALRISVRSDVSQHPSHGRLLSGPTTTRMRWPGITMLLSAVVQGARDPMANEWVITRCTPTILRHSFSRWIGGIQQARRTTPSTYRRTNIVAR